ncbi:diaminopimelate decarboxylase [Arthrobacter sp. CG_A4]|uniref:diaminopimelate decarboxylase n=1 Tax=Arthrobacter sp. CG_A4 TaxID=3071706 RepID=UPI002E0B52EE|nr:diaminopimelate decarboxylase [Arthrobacter sp. CG_A4]
MNTALRREKILQEATSLGLLDAEEAPTAAFLDLDLVAQNVAALMRAFPSHVPTSHAFAAKANSIVPVLAGLRDLGMGCEVASEGELAQALAAGFRPQQIVFDSPAKTSRELRNALAIGVAINIDNFQELERIQTLRAATPSTSSLGIRINPQVGVGGIAAMSTAGASSKFGVPLADEGMREKLVAAYAGDPALDRMHTHVGSQGCPLPLMVDGIALVVNLAEEINRRAGFHQITTIDIGGGLPVDFDTDEPISGFEAYVTQLQSSAPQLFCGDYTVVTEFGRSILAKAGFTAAYVEYTKIAGGQHIAITHAGAHVATRTVFMPEAWPLRIAAHASDGTRKLGSEIGQDIAGPCCFTGDIVARNRNLPLLEPGDLVALLDTGAYYASTPFTYNSIQQPPVYGAAIGTNGDVRFTVLREQQTMAELLAASGSELDAAGRLPWNELKSSANRLWASDDRPGSTGHAAFMTGGRPNAGQRFGTARPQRMESGNSADNPLPYGSA